MRGGSNPMQSAAISGDWVDWKSNQRRGSSPMQSAAISGNWVDWKSNHRRGSSPMQSAAISGNHLVRLEELCVIVPELDDARRLGLQLGVDGAQ
jgi:hypothetical protein